MAVILSFSPKFEAVINTIPTGIIGGISFVLYGMISAIGCLLYTSRFDWWEI